MAIDFGQGGREPVHFPVSSYQLTHLVLIPDPPGGIRSPGMFGYVKSPRFGPVLAVGKPPPYHPPLFAATARSKRWVFHASGNAQIRPSPGSRPCSWGRWRSALPFGALPTSFAAMRTRRSIRSARRRSAPISSRATIHNVMRNAGTSADAGPDQTGGTANPRPHDDRYRAGHDCGQAWTDGDRRSRAGADTEHAALSTEPLGPSITRLSCKSLVAPATTRTNSSPPSARTSRATRCCGAIEGGYLMPPDYARAIYSYVNETARRGLCRTCAGDGRRGRATFRRRCSPPM